ncbi:MAG: hypothetical protein KatS3mg042_0390 [Rhodothermaceae bacterium]|nr:MAG: hypothetical protein KatS3mg042_0390 [Rhodothermaceae bacterium]
MIIATVFSWVNPHVCRMPVVMTLVLLSLWRPARAQEVGTCQPATGEAYLETNDVRARILNNGALFWRGDPHVYEVPRGGGANAIFASAI